MEAANCKIEENTMLGRMILILIAAFLAANALTMLAAPAAWYYSVDGVAATGPLNIHFVRDIGCVSVSEAAGVYGPALLLLLVLAAGARRPVEG
jgi:hypothetical protein